MSIRKLPRRPEQPQDMGQREHIAWCGECGNVSVDGINFSSAETVERPGWLRCAACGAVGPFAYVQEASGLAEVAERERCVRALVAEANRPIHFERPVKRGILYAAKVLSCLPAVGEREGAPLAEKKEKDDSAVSSPSSSPGVEAR